MLSRHEDRGVFRRPLGGSLFYFTGDFFCMFMRPLSQPGVGIIPRMGDCFFWMIANHSKSLHANVNKIGKFYEKKII